MMKLNNFVDRVIERLKLEADSFLWRRSLIKIRNSPRPETDKKILFCDLMVMLGTAKAQALYGAMLRAQGFHCIILLRDQAPGIEKIYTAAIPDVEFVYLDQFSKMDQANRAQKIISSLSTSEDILSLEYNNCRIGKNALSFAVRRLRVGTLDLTNEDHLVIFSEVLQHSLSIAECAPSLIKDLGLDLAIFLERGYTPAGEIFDTCLDQNIKTLQWLSAPQSDSLIFKKYSKDNQSSHPLSLCDESWAILNSEKNDWSTEKENTVLEKLASHYKDGASFNRQQLQVGKTIKSSQAVLKGLGLDENKKTAVIFSHIFYDATFFYGQSIYPDYRKWLVETIRYAIQNTDLNWIVKVHPVNVWRSEMDGVKMEQLEAAALHEEFGDLPEHIKIMSADTNVNTFSLFEFADYGLTVRGTIGMEFPCFGIPIVTAGSGRYSGHGFTIDPETVEDYKETLLNLHLRPKLDVAKIELARKYAYGTFFLRPILMESYIIDYHANTFNSKSMVLNTFVNKSAISQWPEVDDLKTITNWMVSTSEDMLNV